MWLGFSPEVPQDSKLCRKKLLMLPEHRLVTDISTKWSSGYDAVDFFPEQRPVDTDALLYPKVRKRDKDISTFTELDIIQCAGVHLGPEASDGGYMCNVR